MCSQLVSRSAWGKLASLSLLGSDGNSAAATSALVARTGLMTSLRSLKIDHIYAAPTSWLPLVQTLGPQLDSLHLWGVDGSVPREIFSNSLNRSKVRSLTLSVSGLGELFPFILSMKWSTMEHLSISVSFDVNWVTALETNFGNLRSIRFSDGAEALPSSAILRIKKANPGLTSVELSLTLDWNELSGGDFSTPQAWSALPTTVQLRTGLPLWGLKTAEITLAAALASSELQAKSHWPLFSEWSEIAQACMVPGDENIPRRVEIVTRLSQALALSSSGISQPERRSFLRWTVSELGAIGVVLSQQMLEASHIAWLQVNLWEPDDAELMKSALDVMKNFLEGLPLGARFQFSGPHRILGKVSLGDSPVGDIEHEPTDSDYLSRLRAYTILFDEVLASPSGLPMSEADLSQILASICQSPVALIALLRNRQFLAALNSDNHRALSTPIAYLASARSTREEAVLVFDYGIAELIKLCLSRKVEASSAIELTALRFYQHSTPALKLLSQHLGAHWRRLISNPQLPDLLPPPTVELLARGLFLEHATYEEISRAYWESLLRRTWESPSRFSFMPTTTDSVELALEKLHSVSEHFSTLPQSVFEAAQLKEGTELQTQWPAFSAWLRKKLKVVN